MNFRSVRVHFITSRYNGLKEKIIVAFHTLKQSNTLESVHRNLIRRAEVCVLYVTCVVRTTGYARNIYVWTDHRTTDYARSCRSRS